MSALSDMHECTCGRRITTLDQSLLEELAQLLCCGSVPLRVATGLGGDVLILKWQGDRVLHRFGKA